MDGGGVTGLWQRCASPVPSLLNSHRPSIGLMHEVSSVPVHVQRQKKGTNNNTKRRVLRAWHCHRQTPPGASSRKVLRCSARCPLQASTPTISPPIKPALNPFRSPQSPVIHPLPHPQRRPSFPRFSVVNLHPTSLLLLLLSARSPCFVVFIPSAHPAPSADQGQRSFPARRKLAAIIRSPVHPNPHPGLDSPNPLPAI